MPESNGNAFKGTDVFDALDTYLTANGWAQHDNDPQGLGVATGVDTVYVSTGVSGNESMYVRVRLIAKLLDYDAQTGNFTVGQTVTGGTSGNSGLIVFDDDQGATGTLHLVNLSGEFEDNEALTDPIAGAADADGLIYYQDPDTPLNLDHWFDNLIVEGYLYWDNVSHTGVGRMRGWTDENNGPAPMLISPGSDAATDYYFYLDNAPSNVKNWYWVDTANTPRIAGDPAWQGFYPGNHAFDGRAWWRIPDTGSFLNTMNRLDLPSFHQHFVTESGQVDPYGARCPLYLIPNRDTGRHRLYGVHSTGDPSSHWKEWDPRTGVWSNAGAHTFAGSTMFTSTGAWDGADRIYNCSGNNTTGANSWGFYSISAGTWDTSLAVLPAGRNAAHRSQNIAHYIPSGRQAGMVAGVTEDLIYIGLNAAIATLYRYNVTSDTWGPHLTLPVAYDANDRFTVFDGERYLYLVGGQDNNIHRWDFLVNGPGGAGAADLDKWVQLDNWKIGGGAGNGQGVSGLALNHSVCKVPTVRTGTMEYWITGDADSVKLVLKNPVDGGRYFWLYFGRVDNSGYTKTEVMTTTTAITPGAPTTVLVDDSSDYTAGEVILLFDPSSGNVEHTQIIDVPTDTSFRAVVTGSFTSGTLCGVDPNPWCVTSDMWQAVVNLDRLGHESDYMGNVYWLQPGSWGVGTQMSGGRGLRPRPSPSVRDRFQVWPYTLYWHLLQGEPGNEKSGDGQDATTYANPDNGAGHQMHHAEHRGQLFGAFDIDAADEVRGPSAESVMRIDGRLYRVFPQDRIRSPEGEGFSNAGSLSVAARDTNYKWVVLGPID